MSLDFERKAIVISPHQDDALISIGQLLTNYYAQKTILNIFTITGSAILGEAGTEVITHIRQAEEEQVALDYQIEIKNGSFKDCELRGTSWDDQLAKIDPEMLSAVSSWLIQELSNINGDYDVFLPAAFGLHPDHYLALLAFTAESLRVHVQERAKKIFVYGEQPYLTEGTGRHHGHQMLQNFKVTNFPIDPKEKQEMLRHYPSQLSRERVNNLSALSFEYVWEMTPSELKDFLEASQHRFEGGVFHGFNRKDWLDKIRIHYQNDSREFLTVAIPLPNRAILDFPLVIETISIPKLGQVKLARFAGVYASDYFSTEQLLNQSIYADLMQRLTAQGVDVIWFSNLREESQDAQFLMERVHQQDCYRLPNIATVGTVCDLSYDDWLKKSSKNMRRNVKRKWARLSEYANVAMVTISFNVAPPTAASLSQLLQNQYIRADQKGFDHFSQNPEYSGLIQSLNGFPSTYIGELKIGDAVLASLLFFTDEEHKTIAFYMQSFDPRWESYSPSFCAITKLIEYAHKNGYVYVDFLRGEEEYKQHFTNHRVEMIKYIEILNSKLNPGTIIDFISTFEE